MSMNVYRAYKLRNPKDLWPFIRDVRRRGLKNVMKVLERVHGRIMAEIRSDAPDYLDALERYKHEECARSYVAERILAKNYHDQILDGRRNEWDFNVTVAIWELHGQVYVRAFSDWEMRDVLNFLGRHPMLQNFEFWDGTDKPRNKSTREWHHRRAVWEAIDQGRLDHLHLDICSDGLIGIEVDMHREFMERWRKLHPELLKKRTS